MQTRTIIRRTSAIPRISTDRAANPPLAMIWRVVGIALIAAFMVGGLFSGYLFYESVRGVVAAIPQPPVPDLPAAPVARNSSSAPVASASGGGGDTTSPVVPAAAQPAQAQPQLLNTGRVNFLLMGVDLRPGETGPARSDTMIVVTVDPTSKSVGMLSIPRDLWVPIPGYGEDRINTAYFTGDARKYPGGGPALAKKTIQYNFGIPINYYIVINFVGFRKLVDALGGVTIDVPKDLVDPSFPDDTYGYLPLNITKGVHHFNGDEALQYARSRHSESDFGRMRRQQQVLKAIKDQALQLDMLTKIPALWAAKDDAIKTDLTIDKVIALVNLAKDVKADSIQSVVIDEKMALGITTPGGAQVLWPDRERIRAAIDPLFATPEGVPAQPQPQAQVEPQPTPSKTSEQIKKLAAEAARIEISNGTSTEGLSDRVAAWLKSEGYNVVLADNADRQDYEQTVIVESNDRPYTKGLLLTIFGVTQKVRQNPNAKTDIDLRIIIGKDFNEKQIPDSR